MPALIVLLVFTNEMHGLVWPEIVPTVTEGTFVMVYANRPALRSSILPMPTSLLSLRSPCWSSRWSSVPRSTAGGFWLLILCTAIFLLADLIDLFSLFTRYRVSTSTRSRLVFARDSLSSRVPSGTGCSTSRRSCTATCTTAMHVGVIAVDNFGHRDSELQPGSETVPLPAGGDPRMFTQQRRTLAQPISSISRRRIRAGQDEFFPLVNSRRNGGTVPEYRKS